MIDSHGPDHVVELMQKVISALEHLEKFAAETEGEHQTIDDLKTTITHLELEETKRNEERQRNALVKSQKTLCSYVCTCMCLLTAVFYNSFYLAHHNKTSCFFMFKLCRSWNKSRNIINKRHGIFCQLSNGCKMKTGNCLPP